MTELITTSDHVRVAPYTHAALTKGQAVILATGAMVGFADQNYAANEAIGIDIGVKRAVFRAATTEVAGAANIGSPIYITAAGALTMTATSNYLVGVVVDNAGAVSFVKLG